MNILQKTIWMQRRILRKLIWSRHPLLPSPTLDRINDEETVVKIINDALENNEGCMICRFGSNELRVVCNYRIVVEKKYRLLSLITSEVPTPFWADDLFMHFERGGGFFNPSIDNIKRYSRLVLSDVNEIDVLGSWVPEEYLMRDKLTHVKKIAFAWLEPWFSKTPWTKNLEGKTVLVIHPLAELIEKQYKEKREILFENKNVLPLFELKTIKAVQSIGGDDNGFKDWFDALDSMKSKMDKIEYDIALIGCGAYGFNLAAHAKRKHKKAIHMGGALQLLFGIRGNRWDNPKQGFSFFKQEGMYSKLFNDAWVYPGDEFKPKAAAKVDDSAYWKK
nr:hypothetical protein [uncultured Bacteroides sp.]